MKKVTCLTCLITAMLMVLLIVTNVTAADFYKFNWGTSYNKVLKKVDEIEKSDDVIVSSDVIGGYEATISFVFKDHKLVCGIYSFRAQTVGKAVAIFNDVKDKLTRGYGDPVGERTKRFRPLDMSVLTEEGFMIEAMRSDDERIMYGEIGKYIVWTTKHSIISESIEPTDFVPRVVYYQTEYFKQLHKTRNQNNF